LSLRGFAAKLGEDYELLRKRDARKSLPDSVQKKIDKALADHARKTAAE
jgi:hypothetical protein